MSSRQCGGCTLCCYLVPTQEIDLPANTHCPHECAKGCRIYDSRPRSCRTWSCLWLLGHDVGSRPDRSDFVVDVLPDFVTSIDNETGEQTRIPVHQVWVHPDQPEAHRNFALRRWLDGEGRKGIAALIRYGNDDGFLLIPPSMTGGTWIEKRSEHRPEGSHKLSEVMAELLRQGISLELALDDGDRLDLKTKA